MSTNTPPRLERQLKALRLARDCADLGARVRTLVHLTGLPPPELRSLLSSSLRPPARGRAPDSPEWYHRANLLDRAEASITMSLYRRLRHTGFGATDALPAAYRHYRCICVHPHRISFDRAFDLAAHTDGIWIAREPAFDLVNCPSCHSHYLAAYGSTATTNESCPFCKLIRRFEADVRVQASFPYRRPMPNPTGSFGPWIWRPVSSTAAGP
jgi:hypothetical protein